MRPYTFREIEQKWQSLWLKNKVHKAFNPGDPGFDPSKKPFYVLDMFPYPSGSGLHVGHASGYIGTDIIARHKRMQNFNVLHPMGWDAFGLPAEQYALQTGQHPRVTTDQNTANFRRQLQLIGLSYDWDREIDTSKPEYYKWTQWIFLKLYKKGLVYRKEVPVWWCEALKTVLANEEVINGRSERGNHPCERRLLTQWVFRITEYADRLLEDLKTLDWPAGVLKMQEDWIGKSLGTEVKFQVKTRSGENKDISVFTTRADTLMGVTALVLAPELPLVMQITQTSHEKNVQSYVQKTSSKSDRERKAEAQEITAEFTGASARHPITGEAIPIYVADYVLADYGTGAVMAVPSHDERDFLLAKNVGIALKPVIAKPSGELLTNQCFTEDGILVNSGTFDGLTSAEARTRITAFLEKQNAGQARTSYKIRDWIFSRQRYWGEPFPLSVTEQDEIVAAEEVDLPVLLPPMQNFEPSEDGSSPLARAKNWVEWTDSKGRKLFRVTDTMPGWAGSCWYYLRFMDPKNTEAPFSKQALEYWKQVDIYVGGASHAVMHLLYARFWHKALYDLKIVSTPEPFKKLFNQGMVTAFAYKGEDGRLVPSDDVIPDAKGFVQKSTGGRVERIVTKMAKSLRNVINPDDVIQSRGCDTLRLYQMFMGPLNDDKPWADEGMSGCEKFLKRAWAYFNEQIEEQATQPELAFEKPLHKCLKRIDGSYVDFNFNTAVAGLMECLNELQEIPGKMSRSQIEMYLKMMFPLAPHFASELWENLGNKDWIDFAAWPQLNPDYLVENEFELVLQINGKIRKRKRIPIDLEQSAIETLAREELGDLLQSVQVRKVIYVKNKLMNFVVG